MSSLSYAPRHAPATDAFQAFVDNFGEGPIYPYLMFFKPTTTDATPITVFQPAQDFLLQQLLPLSPGANCFSVLNHPALINNTIFANCWAAGANPSCNAFQELGKLFFDNATGSVYAQLTLSINPSGPDGVSWLLRVRSLLASVQGQGNLSYYLVDGQSYQYDLVAACYQDFPMVIGITAAVVFLVMGLAFRSILIPARAVVTIGLTLGLVYGSATLVYQYNALNGLHLAGITGSGSLFWLSPVLSFSILVGLGLDYDIFLITRIAEFRDKGHTDRNAIIMGVARSGRIISAAGGIMAVAFFGLMFSRVAMLNQMSFFLVVAVLTDSMIVRPVLVPILMDLLSAWAWWPGARVRRILDAEGSVLLRSSKVVSVI